MTDKTFASEREEDGIQQKEQGRPPVDEMQTILIKKTMRSGQIIRYPGNVVVMGDVNPGAEIIAGGNIVVMGFLRGVAHAGAAGTDDKIVTAFRLRPTQLRIANHITRAPDEQPEAYPEYPELARIKNGVVVIDRYVPGDKQKA